jgi:Na+/H+-dicarboxylate symporter
MASASGDCAAYANKGKEFSFLEFVMGTVADNALGAFLRGDLLLVAVIALRVGMGPNWDGEPRSFSCSGFKQRDDGIFGNH